MINRKKKNSKILQVCGGLIKFFHKLFHVQFSSLRVRHTRRALLRKRERKKGNARYKTLSRYKCRFHGCTRPTVLFSFHRLSFQCLLSRGRHAIANTRFPVSRSIPRSRFIMQHALQLFAQYPFRVNVAGKVKLLNGRKDVGITSPRNKSRWKRKRWWACNYEMCRYLGKLYDGKKRKTI